MEGRPTRSAVIDAKYALHDSSIVVQLFELMCSVIRCAAAHRGTVAGLLLDKSVGQTLEANSLLHLIKTDGSHHTSKCNVSQFKGFSHDLSIQST